VEIRFSGLLCNRFIADCRGFRWVSYGSDARLANAIKIIKEKQDARGSWLLEYDYTGKTWVNFGAKNQPNKWVTLRALRAIKSSDHYGSGV